jgi:RsiW-degrading membrane proteinase PrsW (M82 family)
VVVIGIGVISAISGIGRRASVGLELALATVIPLTALAGLLFLSRSARRLWPLVLVALLWGVLGVSLVVPINDRWVAALGITSLIVLGAPILEEIAKALVTPFLTISKRVTWFVEGAVLGAAAGTGFAIRENWLYLERVGASEGISLVLARVTSTNLMHAGCTAIVGAAVVLAYGRGIIARFTIPLAGLLIAIALHSGFNRLTQMEDESAILITATGVTVFGVAVGIVFLGFPVSARWVSRDLAQSGATASEQAALSGSSVANVLDDFESRFGVSAAHKAEQLVQAQRELAIRSNSGRGSAQEIQEIKESTEALRRDIGIFAMMWLRSHLPVSSAQPGLWATLEKNVNSVDSRVSTQDNELGQLGGLWARLEEDPPVGEHGLPGSTTQSDPNTQR